MRRKKNPCVMEFTDEQRKKLLDEIEAFYYHVRGEEIDIIEKEQLLALFTEQLSPMIYNKALDDARRWYQLQMENLESDYYLLYKNE